MERTFRLISGAAVLVLVLSLGATAGAQKRGGVLRMYSLDSPASMSILEEPTVYARGPMMSVFNNLLLFDQHIAQDSLASIVPDLGESWVWGEDGKDLRVRLRQGVKWHDGKPFTAADVKCTWDLIMGEAKEKLRVNPWKSGYSILDRLENNGDYEVTFSPEAAAAGVSDAARQQLCTDLSLSCSTGTNAAASDRHRTVQIRRVQTE